MLRSFDARFKHDAKRTSSSGSGVEQVGVELAMAGALPLPTSTAPIVPAIALAAAAMTPDAPAIVAAADISFAGTPGGLAVEAEAAMAAAVAAADKVPRVLSIGDVDGNGGTLDASALLNPLTMLVELALLPELLLRAVFG
jgi:hypothetical protein